MEEALKGLAYDTSKVDGDNKHYGQIVPRSQPTPEIKRIEEDQKNTGQKSEVEGLNFLQHPGYFSGKTFASADYKENEKDNK